MNVNDVDVNDVDSVEMAASSGRQEEKMDQLVNVNEENNDDVLCTMLDAIPERLGMVFQRDADLVAWGDYHCGFADLSVDSAISVSAEVIDTWLVGGPGDLLTCVAVRKYSHLMNKIERRMVTFLKQAVESTEVTDTP